MYYILLFYMNVFTLAFFIVGTMYFWSLMKNVSGGVGTILRADGAILFLGVPLLGYMLINSTVNLINNF